ncbi:polyprotein [Cucumis melo var. makuwa]|uniref:Polyprotein n=1 Tax=Cucumis melo var. makuwa TaxID=1194695 RepID=A0A5D3E2U2_CUCMM|nr:polyprotein [Cucumis melo var. makuwa]TYK30204.1 polyprotein [Cucumis melo var. makuwa]
MELTTLLLEKKFDPRRSSEGVDRENHMGTPTARESTTAKAKASGNFLKKIPTCFKCNKKGHYANRCPVFKKINQIEIDKNEKQSLLKVIKAEELSSEEEEFSSEKEEDFLNAILEESSEEPSSSEDESDNEDAISCYGCINVLTST